MAIVGIAVAAVGMVLAAPAHAGPAVDTVVFEPESGQPGQRINYVGGDHANDVSVDVGVTDIVFHDPNAVSLSTNSPCVLTNSTTVTCPKTSGPTDNDKVRNVSILGNGGDDTITSTGTGMVSGSTFTPIRATLLGHGGNDTITASGGFSAIYGGTGDDALASGPGFTTYAGFLDTVYGEDGNDTINTSTNSPDQDMAWCDTLANQSFAGDSLTKGSNDITGTYGFPPASSDCDTVTIV